jgi:hypothetical protein
MATILLSPSSRLELSRKTLTQRERVLLSFLLLVLICVLRRSDIVLVPQFFVEDGGIFYTQQVVLGTVHALFKSYAGYLLVIPRLLTALSCLAPIRLVPILFATLSICSIAAIGSLLSMNCYRYLIRSDFLRVALPALLFSVTDSAPLVGNFTNLIWYFVPLALLILLIPREFLENLSTLWTLVVGCLMALLALSQPLCIVLVPFVVWRFLTLRRLSRIIPISLLGGIVVQVACFRLVSGSSGVSMPVGRFLQALGVSIGWKAILVTFAGERSSELMSCQTKIEVLTILLALLAGCVTILWRNHAHGPWLVLGCGYLLITSIAVPIRGRLGPSALTSLCASGDGGGCRYYLLGGCVLIFVLLVLVDHFKPRTEIALLVLGGVLWPAFTDNFALPYNKFDSHWTAYVPAIRRWKSARKHCQPAYEMVVPTSPLGWVVDLPALTGCDGQAFPDKYIVTTDQKRFYLVDRGLRRAIPDRKTVDELRVNRVELTADDKVRSMPAGLDVPPLISHLIQNVSTGEVDFIDQGRRRYVPDPHFLVHLGPGNPLQPLSAQQFNSFTLGTTVSSPLPVPTGEISVLQDKHKGTVYLVEDRTKHRIPDSETLNALGVGPVIQSVSGSELASLLASYDLPHVPGRVIQNSATSAVFLIDRGQRHYIPDPATLKAMHLSDQISPVPAGTADAIPLGSPVPHLNAPN